MSRICILADRRARACLSERTDTIAALAADALNDGADTIHDLRVACRRARVALAEFGDQLQPSARREARGLFRDVRRVLGPLREIDAHLARVRAFAGRHPDAAAYASGRLVAERDAALAEIHRRSALPSRASLERAIANVRGPLRETSACYRKQAGRRLRRRLSSLGTQYRAWRETRESDDLHAVRIELKKLRYTLELYVDLYGADGKSVLSETGTLQDSLGAWNDHRILRRHLLGYRPFVPAALRSAFDELLNDVERTAEELHTTASRAVRGLLKSQRQDELKRLFGKPQRPCCDK